MSISKSITKIFDIMFHKQSMKDIEMPFNQNTREAQPNLFSIQEIHENMI